MASKEAPWAQVPDEIKAVIVGAAIGGVFMAATKNAGGGLLIGALLAVGGYLRYQIPPKRWRIFAFGLVAGSIALAFATAERRVSTVKFSCGTAISKGTDYQFEHEDWLDGYCARLLQAYRSRALVAGAGAIGPLLVGLASIRKEITV